MNKKFFTHRQFGLFSGLISGIIIGLILTINFVYATGLDSVKLHRLAQISFIYPLGTNGQNAMNCINGFSINVLAGISGGTSGFETGGLLNIDLGRIKGFQAAGIGNYVKETSSGMQCGGLFNICGKTVRGTQLSGLTNVDLDRLTGLQGAGMVNLTLKNSRGVALAGVTNINLGSLKGAQFGGLVNLTVKEHTGLQVSGLVSLAIKNFRGLQVGGLANITVKDFKGVQAGGLFNYSGKLHGLQIGFINYDDSIAKGLPIGFISIVKHGYLRVELEANETLYGNISLKTGSSHLYNIIAAGYRYKDKIPYWAVTYGLGTLIPVNNYFGFNVDLTATHLNENAVWTRQLNMLNRLKLDAFFKIADGVELYGGASDNVMVSKLTDEEGKPVGGRLVPNTVFYENVFNRTYLNIAPGINGGIRF